MSKGNVIVETLGSMKLTLVILAVFAVAIAAATFIESARGTVAARALVYNARWFEALLALLVLNLVVSLLANMPYNVRQTGFVITHIGFIVVLVAAGITRYMGYEGTMPIREGESTDYMYSAQDYIQVVGDGETGSFPVRLYRPGTQSVHGSVTLGGERYRVRIGEYWPHFERRVVEAPGGSPVLVMSMTGRGEGIVLPVGQEIEGDQVSVRFVAGDEELPRAVAARGVLVVHFQGSHESLAVPEDPPAELRIGDYVCRITEFAPAYRVGAKPNPDDPMTNPAIRVEITTPQGQTQERLLFAYHPDFDMGHSGATSIPIPLELTYEYRRHVYLTAHGDSVTAVADFDAELVPMGAQRPDTTVRAGQRFGLPTRMVLQSGAFAMLVTQVWESGVEEPSLSSNSDDPAAVRVSVENGAGDRAEAIVMRFRGAETVQVGGRSLRLGYGPVRVSLPYSLHLDDFVMKTYPGSENPASYESHVRIFDEARGVDGRPFRIYMNHPLTYRGYKHFQSSYDRDRRGTILSVNHDPGKLPTYFGYTMIGVGFLITLTRGAWYRKRTVRS